MTYADVTLKQLGGSRRLTAMIGAKHYMSDNDGRTLQFKHMAGRNKSNFIEITLNSLDLYDVKFIKIGRRSKNNPCGTVTTVSEINNVYGDQLKSLFVRETGLAITL